MNIPSISYKVAIASLVLLLLGAAGVRLHWFHFQIGLLMFSLAGMLSFSSIFAAALFTRRTASAAGRRQLSLASIIALPTIIFFSLSLYSGAGTLSTPMGEVEIDGLAEAVVPALRKTMERI